jgi:hypothetical protein
MQGFHLFHSFGGDTGGRAVDIEGPTYMNLNWLIGWFAWWLTASTRFDSVVKSTSPSSRRTLFPMRV